MDNKFKKGMTPWNKGKSGYTISPCSMEHKEKLSRAKKGKKFSVSHRKALSLAKLGKPAPNKGKNIWKEKVHPSLGKRLSPEHKAKLKFFPKGHEPWNKGKKGLVKFSFESRKLLSEMRKGPNAPAWKGGITAPHLLARTTFQQREWRKSVFERDDYTCVFCDKRGGNLHADHIKPFALYPELRTDIDNGRTLCVPCHRKTDTYGYKKIYATR